MRQRSKLKDSAFGASDGALRLEPHRQRSFMNVLVLAPETPDARLNDVDYAQSLARYEGAKVFRLDPEVAYRDGGLAGLERELLRQIAEQRIDVLVYAL